MISGQLALVTAALFTGAAIYVSAVEHPARMALDDRAMLTEWKPAYKRGFAMQASLAAIGFLLGAWAFWETQNWLWLAGGLTLLAGWPYTLIVILPTNNRLAGDAHRGGQCRDAGADRQVGGPTRRAHRPRRRRDAPLPAGLDLSRQDDEASVLRFFLLAAELVEVLQQRIEAPAPGSGVQVDAADLLDQLLQRFELLQAQEQRVVLHQLGGIEQ